MVKQLASGAILSMNSPANSTDTRGVKLNDASIQHILSQDPSRMAILPCNLNISTPSIQDKSIDEIRLSIPTGGFSRQNMAVNSTSLSNILLPSSCNETPYSNTKLPSIIGEARMQSITRPGRQLSQSLDFNSIESVKQFPNVDFQIAQTPQNTIKSPRFKQEQVLDSIRNKFNNTERPQPPIIKSCLRSSHQEYVFRSSQKQMVFKNYKQPVAATPKPIDSTDFEL